MEIKETAECSDNSLLAWDAHAIYRYFRVRIRVYHQQGLAWNMERGYLLLNLVSATHGTFIECARAASNKSRDNDDPHMVLVWVLDLKIDCSDPGSLLWQLLSVFGEVKPRLLGEQLSMLDEREVGVVVVFDKELDRWEVSSFSSSR